MHTAETNGFPVSGVVRYTASMRPRLARRGNKAGPLSRCRLLFSFNEAAACTPRKPGRMMRIDTSPLCASMRPRHARRGNSRLSTPWYCMQSCGRFERWQSSPAPRRRDVGIVHIRLSKTPAFSDISAASSGSRQQRRTEPLESTRQRDRRPRLSTIYITTARRSIPANVLPMLATASLVRSAGPTSMSSTWSSPAFTSSRNRASSSTRRRDDRRHWNTDNWSHSPKPFMHLKTRRQRRGSPMS